jgi:hypothetical protein
MPSYESHIDRLIREATERGEFDNLPGAGKPLNLGGADDPDWWIKSKMRQEGLDFERCPADGGVAAQGSGRVPGIVAGVGN